MIQRFAHNQPLYKADNATVYSQLVVATLSSQYASTISPFKRANNVCGEINELISQFHVAAHWERVVKVQVESLLNGKWNV